MEPLSAAELRRLGGIVVEAQQAMDIFNQAVGHQRRAEWQAARDAFSRVANMGVPYVSARAALNVGILLEEQWHDLDGARRAYERAATTGQDTDVGPNAELLLGNVHARLGDGNAAFQAFRRAYESGFPSVVPKAMFAIGLLYENIGDFRGARLAYEAAIETGDRSVAQTPRKGCVAWRDEGDTMSDVEPLAGESWWAAYERDIQRSDGPFHAIFTAIVAQSAVVSGPAWPGCSLAVSRLDGDAGGQGADGYGVRAATRPDTAGAVVELNVFLDAFGPGAFAAVPALLVRECVCHVPIGPREGLADDADRGLFREGFLDWAAEFFLHRWAGLLPADVSTPARRHGMAVLLLERMGATPRCHSRRVGRRCAEELAAWLRDYAHLGAEAADASVARFAIELKAQDSSAEYKDLVVSGLRYRPYPVDIGAALADWVEHRGDIASVVRVATS